MKKTVCPSPEALRQLAQGQLPAEQVRDLEQHLRNCRNCTRVLQTLSTEEPAEAATLAATEAGRPPIPPLAPSATASRTFDFLAAAQQPDELGRLGPYRVLKVLGQGGMGVVFRAEDSRLHRSVALKVMLPDQAQRPEAKERFLREARAAAALEHDHIVPIFQVDEDRGVPYIAMPLLKGLSLDDWLKQKKQGGRGKPLTLPQVFKIGREIARGLAAAHARGLVHRDIKPANLWLDATAGGRVKILDFGLARATSGESQLTQSGAIVGTPAYMAPEQAQGQKVDARADLFSLGVVLYRLCTGELPFTGTDVVSTLVAVATSMPAPPRALNPELPSALSDLVLQLLEKDPARRVAGAADVVKALQAIERDLSAPKGTDATAVEPARPVMNEQARSAARPRRRRLLLTGAGLLVLMLLALFAGPLFQWVIGKGALSVKVDDPDVQVLVKQNGVVVQDRTTRRTFTISAGDGAVEVFDKDGLGPLLTETFTLSRAGTATVTIDMAQARARLPGLRLDPGGPTAWVERIQFTPDGKQLLSSSAHDRGIRLWDVATGKSRRVLHPPGGESPWFTLSPDGQKLAVSSSYKVGKKINDIIYLMTLADGRVERVLQGHAGGVHALAFSWDGKRLASGGQDRTIRIWNLASGEAERVFETASPVHGLAWSPDGSRLANDFVDSDACDLRDLATGKIVVRLKGGEVSGWFAGHTVAWSPDGGTLATCGRGGLRLWRPDGTLRLHLYKSVEPTMAVAFNADSSRVLATLRNGKHAIFHNRTGKPALEFPQSPLPNDQGLFNDCVWSRDGKLAATCGGWKGVYDIFLWNPATGALVKRLALHNWLSGPDLQAGWSADGQTVSWRSVDPALWKGGPTTFHLGELRLGRPLPREQLRGRVLRQGPISLAPVSANTVQVLKDGKPFTDLQLRGPHRLEQPDAFTLVGQDRAVLGSWVDSVFDTNTGKVLRTYNRNAPVWALAPSPDGRHLLSFGYDQKLRIFDLNRPESLLTLYVSGQDWVLWTPKGNYYAASPGGERFIRWRVGNGIDKEPTFYSAERFRKERYRPDVLKRVLEKGSVEEALAAADAALKGR